jgi:glycerophosphoryl diester phosphodiesterase
MQQSASLTTDSTSQRARPRIIAHRGASMVAPENTLPAFRLAVEAGAEIIETDVHLARDGSLVLIHDADLARTTSCSGSVMNHGLSELRACDAGYWFSANGDRMHPFRGLGLTVPVLRDLFDLLDSMHADVLVNIEIKNIPGELDYDPTERCAARLVAHLHELGVAQRVIVSSFNPAAIDRVKQEDARIQTAYVCAPWADLHARTAYAVARGHEALHPHHGTLGTGRMAQRMVQMMRQAGLVIRVWTVNDPERMRELAVAGVDGIISDDPALLRQVLLEADRASAG